MSLSIALSSCIDTLFMYSHCEDELQFLMSKLLSNSADEWFSDILDLLVFITYVNDAF